MTETIEYEQFEQTAGAPGGESGGPSDVDLSRLSDIPMELSVEIGRTHMTVGETLDLRVGSVVALERLAGETADLLVNGTAIARGEVVVIDEQYGLRITVILDGHAELELGEAGAGEAGGGVEAGGADAGGDEAPGASAVAADGPDTPGASVSDAPTPDAPTPDAPAADQQPTDAAEGDGG
ncbi:MAG TPA: flagellar motor switch protein FliN [Solirubrobacteraceae bacterium]|nr:flagellar motor switch protein FliN [Solirubrobacteraceae bacterium]